MMFIHYANIFELYNYVHSRKTRIVMFKVLVRCAFGDSVTLEFVIDVVGYIP